MLVLQLSVEVSPLSTVSQADMSPCATLLPLLLLNTVTVLIQNVPPKPPALTGRACGR